MKESIFYEATARTRVKSSISKKMTHEDRLEKAINTNYNRKWPNG